MQARSYKSVRSKCSLYSFTQFKLIQFYQQIAILPAALIVVDYSPILGYYFVNPKAADSCLKNLNCANERNHPLPLPRILGGL